MTDQSSLALGLAFSVTAFAGDFADITIPELKKAKELGYTNVKHLSAGITGWKEAGEKTEVVAK